MIKFVTKLAFTAALFAWARYQNRKPRLPEYSSTVELMLPFRAVVKVRANSQAEANMKANAMANDIRKFTYACDTYTGIVTRRRNWFRKSEPQFTP